MDGCPKDASRRAVATIARLVALLLATACTGAIGDPTADAVGDPDRPGEVPCTGAACERRPASCGVAGEPATRLPRLSHAEYDNTVRDLLGIGGSPASTFLEDADPTTARRAVSDRLTRDYARAAEELAAEVLASTALLERLLPCDPAEAGCGGRAIREIGQKAYRRPLTESEAAAYDALFARGAELVASGDAFRDGLELVLEAMLQSPHFLYRVERSAARSDALVALDDFEIASRLSYLVWSSMPDEVLFAAAAAGELRTPEQVADQARRMLDDPRASTMVTAFHDQLLDRSRYADLYRSPEVHPGWDAAAMARAMQAESDRFVTGVVLETRGTFVDLLTAPHTYVSDDLAPLYGLSGSYGSELSRVDLDPTERAGILTQIGLLAANAYADRTDPIHRGVFIHERILCTELPPPPPDAEGTPFPDAAGELVTTRDRVEAQTSPPECRSCHGMINPVGFALERFDEVGRIRVEDNGAPIDATGDIVLDGTTHRFDGAVELASAIGHSAQARRCYATHWVELAYGRQAEPADACTIDRLEDELASGTIVDAIVAITQTELFMNRRSEVTP